eukprot:CAMPEP_0173191912 /NCGR_PEP_ID=MMETSP1141-20130122/13142_1 /TAXON_ID=483371 /ORGANISM="non described non described, Strain CCMP2298" /LENGTH=506 /DNA_ID=CAMNT_0014116141 /DNA_START=33 /DNA_END=1553 /DNA_ORIENTATION=+
MTNTFRIVGRIVVLGAVFILIAVVRHGGEITSTLSSLSTTSVSPEVALPLSSMASVASMDDARRLEWTEPSNREHTHAWKQYAVVDGLRNEEVVMVVTSTSTHGEKLLRERIMASSRTWMRMFANVVVVIEDSFPIRFAMRNCQLIDSPLLTAFKCHNEPIYVLSRTCTDEYYGAAGPCCKVDDALNWIVNVQKELFGHIKFLLHCDDDMYWRPLQTLRWLASVQKSGANRYPLIANLQFGDKDNKGVWMIKGCDEVRTTGWYQPLMLNHAMLQKMAAALASYGTRDTCKNFDVTHDIGVGVLAWMFRPFHLQMPNTIGNGDHQGYKVMKPTDMAMHYIKHMDSEKCDGKEKEWNAVRYKQNVVLGCGDVDQPSPGHDKNQRADMYDAMKYYQEHGVNITLEKVGENDYILGHVVISDGSVKHILDEDNIELMPDGRFRTPSGQFRTVEGVMVGLEEGERVEQRVIPKLLALVGYDTTAHSKEHDVTKQWAAFSLKDCSPPGKKDT